MEVNSARLRGDTRPAALRCARDRGGVAGEDPVEGGGLSPERTRTYVRIAASPVQVAFLLQIPQLAEFGTVARALLLCSPHNPTGSVPSRQQLEAIADSAARHDA